MYNNVLNATHKIQLNPIIFIKKIDVILKLIELRYR